jgi:hypothetical protein
MVSSLSSPALSCRHIKRPWIKFSQRLETPSHGRCNRCADRKDLHKLGQKQTNMGDRAQQSWSCVPAVLELFEHMPWVYAGDTLLCLDHPPLDSCDFHDPTRYADASDDVGRNSSLGQRRCRAYRSAFVRGRHSTRRDLQGSQQKQSNARDYPGRHRNGGQSLRVPVFT